MKPARVAVALVPLMAMPAALMSQPNSVKEPPTASSQQSSRPSIATTQNGSLRDATNLIRRMIIELDSPDFKTREASQASLARLGEAAMPTLVEFVGHKNPEIANRVAALIKRPVDPALRVETAVRLLTTADPDWMEMGVYMVFESPLDDCDLFAARANGAKGIDKAILKPVSEQLKEWREITIRHQDYIKRHSALGHKDIVQRQDELHKGSMYYQAEAALAYAVEAAEEYQAVDGSAPNATTQPSTSQPAATSRPSLVKP